jgi:hypothetical protein
MERKDLIEQIDEQGLEQELDALEERIRTKIRAGLCCIIGACGVYDDSPVQ